MLLAMRRASSIVSTLAMSASAFVWRPNKLPDKVRTGAREVSKMTSKEALALRLPNGTRLGDASPDELEAEAARLATVAEAIKNGTLERAAILTEQAGLKPETVGTRFNIAAQDMIKRIDKNTSNISILMNDYNDLCIEVMTDVDKRARIGWNARCSVKRLA
jgi:hypothetical protein